MGLFSKKRKESVESEVSMAVDETAPASDNDELIAVLAAAIAAYEAEQFVQTLYIQKINRTCGPHPAWAAMGTQEAIDTRRM